MSVQTVTPVSAELLAALAAEAPEPTTTARPPKNASPVGDRFASRLDVPAWLASRGVAYSVKPTPDSLGRTVYVLKECPFDPSHGSTREVAVMQSPEGKMSALCMHNSCTGRGWQEFKEAIGVPAASYYDPPLTEKAPKCPVQPPGPPSPPRETPESSERIKRPVIMSNKRQLRNVTADAIAALLAANEPPQVFQRGSLLVRLRPGDDGGRPVIEVLTDAALRGILARVADWMREVEKKQRTELEDGPPPMEVVRDMAGLPDWPGIPGLDTVTDTPVFAANGDLVMAAGFHPDARVWMHAALEISPVSPDPDPGEVARAVALLADDLLGDFPFRSAADRATAFAALLLPFGRSLIDGPTPLHLFDAPSEGSGKTLLVNAIGAVVLGRVPEATAEGACDEEWRKRITACLAEAPLVVFLDNINRPLDSGALASVLTTTRWRDRILGTSKVANLPNTAVWLASGNNVRLSHELCRRVVRCRLDARVEVPSRCTGFRHAHLVRWATANRAELVRAVLTLWRAWLAAGRPAGERTIGMYESWAETIGGVLAVAGVPGFLEELDELRAETVGEDREWRPFVALWHERIGSRVVGTHELHTLAVREKLLDGVLGDGGERGQRTRLGLGLSKQADRVFGPHRVVRAGEDNKARQLYRLIPADGPPRSATSA